MNIEAIAPETGIINLVFSTPKDIRNHIVKNKKFFYSHVGTMEQATGPLSQHHLL